jgi:hypothetical protein
MLQCKNIGTPPATSLYQECHTNRRRKRAVDSDDVFEDTAQRQYSFKKRSSVENVGNGENSSSSEFLSTLVKCIINISNEQVKYRYLYLIYLCMKICWRYAFYYFYCSLNTDNANSMHCNLTQPMVQCKNIGTPLATSLYQECHTNRRRKRAVDSDDVFEDTPLTCHMS